MTPPRRLALRAAILGSLCLVALSAPPVDAQPAPKVPRIGYLSEGSASRAGPLLEPFRQGLRELGYVEGQNIAIEYRWAEENPARLPDLAAQLVRLKPDVIVAAASRPARAAKQATTSIPIVMIAIADPVGTGLVSSLARPGGNATALSITSPELSAKRLELLREIVPGIGRVGVLLNPTNPGSQPQLKETESAARVLGVQLRVVEARDMNELGRAFSAMARERVEAVVVLTDVVFSREAERLADEAARRRLPAVYAFKAFAEAGGLLTYGPSFPHVARRGAYYVDRILKGTRPADLPVEQPATFELVVNLKTARALGLTVPQSILIRADQVIK